MLKNCYLLFVKMTKNTAIVYGYVRIVLTTLYHTFPGVAIYDSFF